MRAAIAPEAIGLWEAAGREVGYTEMAEALRAGFGEAFGVAFVDSTPTPEETARWRAIAPGVLLNPAE